MKDFSAAAFQPSKPVNGMPENLGIVDEGFFLKEQTVSGVLGPEIWKVGEISNNSSSSQLEFSDSNHLRVSEIHDHPKWMEQIQWNPVISKLIPDSINSPNLALKLTLSVS